MVSVPEHSRSVAGMDPNTDTRAYELLSTYFGRLQTGFHELRLLELICRRFLGCFKVYVRHTSPPVTTQLLRKIHDFCEHTASNPVADTTSLAGLLSSYGFCDFEFHAAARGRCVESFPARNKLTGNILVAFIAACSVARPVYLGR